VISVFSVTLVTIFGQTRILYAIGRDGLVPSIFQQVNARTRTPVGNTLIVCTVVGIVAGVVDSEFLWDMVSMGTLTAFCVVAVAVPVLRHKRGSSAADGFRVPFGPYLVPGLSVAACLYIMRDLSQTTLRVFAIWMTFAVATYLVFGIRHSRLNLAA
jgi:APA family basic amino acid/polyamine antiporter